MTHAADDLASVRAALADHAEPLLIALFGEPTTKHRREWRWGRKGSLSFSFDKMAIYDHEVQRGGSLIDAVCMARSCSFADATDWARRWLGATPKPDSCRRPEARHDLKGRASEPKVPPDQDKLDWLLGQLLPIEGTVVETYLKDVRGVDLPTDGHHLRYLPANPPRYEWPCMVGIVSDFADADRVIDLHFTRLALHGSGKARIEAPKGTLKGFSPRGGVVRLCDDADVTVRLGVAEGIEKALSIMSSHRRDLDRDEMVWSAISAGNMRKLPVVPGIETLAIYGDKNEAGHKAVAELKKRWLDAGRETETHFPPGADWDEAP